MNQPHVPARPVFPINSFDAQRIEDAFALMGPKWTTWSVMALAQEGRPMRIRDIAAKLPFVSEQVLGLRLAATQTGGLVTRTDTRHGAPYRLSALGESLTHVHRTLADWSRIYLAPDATAEAERVEDAVGRLRPRHSTALIQVLADGGPMRFGHIAEGIGRADAFTRQRLLRLQADGLVTRTGPQHGAPYTLTDAGQELGPVYATVERWSAPLVHPVDPVAPCPRRDDPADPLRCPVGVGRRPNRSSPAPERCRTERPVQPRLPAATAGADCRNHSVGPGTGQVIRVALRTRGTPPSRRRPRAPRPFTALRTRARSPPPTRAWSFDHVRPSRPVPPRRGTGQPQVSRRLQRDRRRRLRPRGPLATPLPRRRAPASSSSPLPTSGSGSAGSATTSSCGGSPRPRTPSPRPAGRRPSTTSPRPRSSPASPPPWPRTTPHPTRTRTTDASWRTRRCAGPMPSSRCSMPAGAEGQPSTEPSRSPLPTGWQVSRSTLFAADGTPRPSCCGPVPGAGVRGRRWCSRPAPRPI